MEQERRDRGEPPFEAELERIREQADPATMTAFASTIVDTEAGTMVPKRQTSWSAPELMAAVFPELKWAVPGIVAEGASLLAGSPKVGKSWLALNLAFAVAAGGTALGKLDVDEGDVLNLALEDPGRRLRGESTVPAKELCGRCPVRAECLDFALRNGERYGVWVG